MDIDGSGEHISIEFSPDFFEEYLAIDGSSLVLYQILEEIEFFGREFYWESSFCHQSLGCIYGDISNRYKCGFIGDISPAKCLYSGNKFLEIKRFPQIIVGSEIESSYHIFGGVSGG